MICIGLRGGKSDGVEQHYELRASMGGYELLE